MEGLVDMLGFGIFGDDNVQSTDDGSGWTMNPTPGPAEGGGIDQAVQKILGSGGGASDPSLTPTFVNSSGGATPPRNATSSSGTGATLASMATTGGLIVAGIVVVALVASSMKGSKRATPNRRRKHGRRRARR